MMSVYGLFRFLAKAYPLPRRHSEYEKRLEGRELWIVGMGRYRWILGTCVLHYNLAISLKNILALKFFFV